MISKRRQEAEEDEAERREQVRRAEDLSVRGPFGLSAHASGPNTMIALLIVVCFSGIVFLGWVHHNELQAAQAQTAAHIQRIEDHFGETAYILTLPQEKREQLRLDMPESLRQKTHRRNQGD